MVVTASGGTLTMRFEVIQREREKPTRFAGRIVGWRDHTTFNSGGEPPGV
jgi:hypothetical protein